MLTDGILDKKIDTSSDEEEEAKKSVEKFKSNYKDKTAPSTAVFLSCLTQTFLGEWGDKS